MRKIIIIKFILTISISCYGQDTEMFAKKVSDKMCDCIGQVHEYKNLKPKLDECYDKEMNEAVIHATPEEIKIIGNIGEFNKTKQIIGKLIKTDCPTVKKLVESEAQGSVNSYSYPTNFDSKDFTKAINTPSKWDGKIIAFDGEIIEVNYPSPYKPYLKVRIKDDKVIWVGSMVNSKYDKVGNVIRFLGYFIQTAEDDISVVYHNQGFHVLAFAEIDQTTKQLVFIPGSESQIKEWSNGKIPTAK